ncbi:subclass B1 metallo-beta-lactamase [Leptospira sp. 96542]|nr:subclass B1 metallo-beta-lactamase [Leptospira sp. 96542]
MFFVGWVLVLNLRNFYFFITVLVFICGCASFTKTTDSELPPLELIKIKESVWIHRSYGKHEGVVYQANGLVVVTPKGIVLIDTAWTEKQTEELIRLTKEKFSLDIRFAIISHGHADRVSGIRILEKHNIVSYSTTLTAIEVGKNGFPKPVSHLDYNNRMSLGNTQIEVYYPGPGHSVDNIVVWLPDTHILFAGCLLKSVDSKDLGFVGDANLNEWPRSAKRLLDRYPDAEVIVPGHGDWGKLDLIRHTLRLLDNHPNKK